MMLNKQQLFSHHFMLMMMAMMTMTCDYHLFVVGAAAGDDDNIIAVAEGQPDLSTFVEAVQHAGLTAVLSDEDKSYTVFAPTDAAFATAYPGGNINDINAVELKNVLLKHIVEGAYNASYFGSNVELESLQGTGLEFSAVNTGGGAGAVADGTTQLRYKVNEVFFHESSGSPNYPASNGILHKIDGILNPVTPTDTPTPDPTPAPTPEPSYEPTATPSEEPTDFPTDVPTEEPTEEPSKKPTKYPTRRPTTPDNVDGSKANEEITVTDTEIKATATDASTTSSASATSDSHVAVLAVVVVAIVTTSTTLC